MTELARQLRDARRQRGWDISTCARQLGVGRGTYRSWETGRRRPADHRWHTINRALGVPLTAFEEQTVDT